MIVKKIIEPRYVVEMTAEQNESIRSGIAALLRGDSYKELGTQEREALDDLRVSLLNTG